MDIARVQPGAVGVGGGGDEEVRGAAERLVSSVDNGGSEPAIADSDRVIDRQGVEVLLEGAERAQPLGAHGGGLW